MYKSLSEDWDTYQQGDYIVVNNVWGRGNLVNGTDYTQSIGIANTDDLTSGIVMSWNWNVDPSSNAVLAYPEISVGYKPWDDPSVGTKSLSAKILDIRTFKVTHDLVATADTVTGNTDGFNVSYDLWLTSKPLGDENTITTELMIWAHRGGPDYIEDATVGTYQQGGVTYDIVSRPDFGDPSGGTNSWGYIALVPRSDNLKATVDVRAIFTMLIDRQLISEADYLTGYELGAEITGGSGGLTVNDISYSLERFRSNGHPNSLVGTSSRDRIFGLGGNDTITGKQGNDFISGGAGCDTLAGGLGKDMFYFNEPVKSWDKIREFAVGIDKVALDSHTFAALSKGQLPEQSFAVATTFATEDVHLIYNAKSGKLYYDGDGSGTADAASLVAVFENHAKLTYSDFIVL